MISHDRSLLDTCVKSIQNALSERGNVYKSCLLSSKFVEDIKNQIKEDEKQLEDISQSFDPLTTSMANQEGQVVSLLDKIKSLTHDKDKIIGRVGELQSLITLKMDTMLSALKEAQDAIATNDLADLQSVEMQSFLFNSLI